MLTARVCYWFTFGIALGIYQVKLSKRLGLRWNFEEKYSIRGERGLI